MSPITTHVLDTSAGRPAAGIGVTCFLWSVEEERFELVGRGVTNEDGRVTDLLSSTDTLNPGRYRLTFETGPYFAAHNWESFYPYVVIVFDVKQGHEHYHVPVLMSPYGYTTYRGS